jgi:glycosyltransferase involved in cell wall biosynthesis
MDSSSRAVVVFDRYTGPAAEDIAKFVEAIATALGEYGDVLSLCSDGAARTRGSRSRPGQSVAKGVRAAVRALQPDLVIYVPSPKPMLSTFYRGSTLRKSAGEANHVMVVLVPFVGTRSPAALLRMLYPGVILVPSYKSLLSLSRLSLDGDVLRFGVDPVAYRPANREERATMRKRHGIGENAFVFLLGSRNHTDGRQVVAALGETGDAQIIEATQQRLVDSSTGQRGRRPVPRTEDPRECYSFADCFVFAGTDVNESVEIPVGVVEALACGVPVLTTPFGGLRDFFLDGPDLRYWNSVEQLADAARRLRENYPARVRSVDEFSWHNVVRQIREHFCM